MTMPLEITGQLATVNLVGSAPAGALTCLVSHQIKRPFRALRWLVSFNLNQQRLVKHYLYVSPDSSKVAALPDAGFDVLSEHSPYNALVGDDQIKEVFHTIAMQEGCGFLKVYCQNDDAFAHDIDVQVTVEVF